MLRGHGEGEREVNESLSPGPGVDSGEQEQDENMRSTELNMVEEVFMEVCKEQVHDHAHADQVATAETTPGTRAEQVPEAADSQEGTLRGGRLKVKELRTVIVVRNSGDELVPVPAVEEVPITVDDAQGRPVEAGWEVDKGQARTGVKGVTGIVEMVPVTATQWEEQVEYTAEQVLAAVEGEETVAEQVPVAAEYREVQVTEEGVDKWEEQDG